MYANVQLFSDAKLEAKPSVKSLLEMCFYCYVNVIG